MNTGGAIHHMDDVEAQEGTSFGECAPARQSEFVHVAPAGRTLNMLATNDTSIFHITLVLLDSLIFD